MMVGTIRGIRTNRVTGKKSNVELRYVLENQPRYDGRDEKGEVKYVNTPHFRLLNGVTGYEAWYIDEEFIRNTTKRGLWDCAGTKDRWDSLWISAEEMSKVFQDSKETGA